MQFGIVKAMRSVRKERKESGGTLSGMPPIRILFGLERSSKSSTLADNRATSSSRDEWESMRELCDFAHFLFNVISP